MSRMHKGWVCCEDGAVYINVRAISIVHNTSNGTWVFGPGLAEEGWKLTGEQATDLENALNEGWRDEDENVTTA